MDTSDAPQVVDYIMQSVSFTPYVTRWIPGYPKFFLLGETPSCTGHFVLLELDKGKLQSCFQKECTSAIKCGTYCFSASGAPCIAAGHFDGSVSLWDINNMSAPLWHVRKHEKIVNSMDTNSSKESSFGVPEIVTGGRDGSVMLWDTRQGEQVLSLEPAEGADAVDCWSVSFGNAHNEEDKIITCGYDNGDLKLFDLRKTTLLWDENVNYGICHIQFDRKDIPMNKVISSTLEGNIFVSDLRTFHPKEGFSRKKFSVGKSTIWGSYFLHQNREIFATCGGDGKMSIFKYVYPPQRHAKDPEMNADRGIVGNLELLNDKQISTQPLVSFDWHPNKLGLCVMSSLEQNIRISYVTKLNLY